MSVQSLSKIKVPLLSKVDRFESIIRRYLRAILVVALLILMGNFIPSIRSVTLSATSNSVGANGPIDPNAGKPGVAVSGVHCGPGVRQVPWSHYAPICEPAWHGNNGGSTAPGVTRTTITLTYRAAASSELQSLYSLVPPSVIGTNSEGEATMQAYINTFNKEFELYGRHVVLRPFVGKGDFVSELNGGGQTNALADALTAKSLGAFADSSVLDSTPVYEDALAQQKIIGFSIFGGPNSEFKINAPYEYSTSPLCSKTVQETVQFVGRSLAKSPVSFAGSSAMNGKKRVFGFIGTSAAGYASCNAQIVKDLKDQYGVTVNPVINMSLSGSLSTQASGAIAQLKAAGVTTIICTTCDFFSPIFLTEAADAQNYTPEWIQSNFLDALTKLQSSNQLAHTEGIGMVSPPVTHTESYTAFELGKKPREKIIPSSYYVYQPLLMFFDALQAAGPDLTPTTFREGFSSLPHSIPGGMYGGWSFNAHEFDPASNYGIIRWSNSVPSPVDDVPGTWLACNSGELYNFNGEPPQLPIGQEPNCPSSQTLTNKSLPPGMPGSTGAHA